MQFFKYVMVTILCVSLLSTSCNENNEDIEEIEMTIDDVPGDDGAMSSDDEGVVGSSELLDVSGVTGFNQNVTDLADWDLVFEDQFDSDLSNWAIWNGGAYNNELQHYQEENLILEDGYLFIKGKRESVTGSTTNFDSTLKNFDFTSGRIESNVEFSAGNTNGATKLRISSRILLPEGQGLWPAFWTYGDPWPTQGEIDILEFRGNETSTYVTNFFYGTSPGVISTNPAQTTQNLSVEGNITQNWHVFELIWSENTFEIVFDGELRYTYTEEEWAVIDDIYTKSQRVILNMALGGDFFQPNVNPATIPDESFTVVDWVRVYKQ